MTRIWKAARRAQENSCKRIFTDKLSGAQAERPGLKEALSHLREADTPRGLEAGSTRAQRERFGGFGQ